MKVRDKGVRNGFLMFTRDDGMIVYSNYDAMELLQVSPGQIYGRSNLRGPSASETVPEENREKWGGADALRWKRLAFDIWNASTHGTYVGYMLVMDEKAESRKELRLRRLKVEKKHRAKYTFGQIIGESTVMTQCKEIARSMAGVLRQRADHRAVRQRQGTVCTGDSQRIAPQRAAVYLRQLRRPGGDASGERTVWVRGRGLHGSQERGEGRTV